MKIAEIIEKERIEKEEGKKRVKTGRIIILVSLITILIEIGRRMI
jgi:hypothetical protein